MRVLPTTYRGVRFRSRTEARWAKVFDEIGWTYTYEPETYVLRSGYYLPDFLISEGDFFFEVKGRPPTKSERDLCEQLAEKTERVVVVSHGAPNPSRKEWDEDLTVFYPERDEDGQPFACEYYGGFVSRRRPQHPCCSISLGNLAHLGAMNEVGWLTAFQRAANARFGAFE